MINWFLLYFIITGLITYKQLTRLERTDLPKEEQDKIDEMNREIFCRFGTLNIYPILYCFGLLLGWILLPVAIICSLFDVQI